MDQIYEDKLDVKIDEGFWQRKTQEWRDQEQSLESRIEAIKQPVGPEQTRNAKRILELANKASFFILRRTQRKEAVC
jgi:hypothetical protein